MTKESKPGTSFCTLLYWSTPKNYHFALTPFFVKEREIPSRYRMTISLYPFMTWFYCVWF